MARARLAAQLDDSIRIKVIAARRARVVVNNDGAVICHISEELKYGRSAVESLIVGRWEHQGVIPAGKLGFEAQLNGLARGLCTASYNDRHMLEAGGVDLLPCDAGDDLAFGMAEVHSFAIGTLHYYSCDAGLCKMSNLFAEGWKVEIFRLLEEKCHNGHVYSWDQGIAV